MSRSLFLVQIAGPSASNDEEHDHRPEYAQNDVIKEIDRETPDEAIVTP